MIQACSSYTFHWSILNMLLPLRSKIDCQWNRWNARNGIAQVLFENVLPRSVLGAHAAGEQIKSLAVFTWCQQLWGSCQSGTYGTNHFSLVLMGKSLLLLLCYITADNSKIVLPGKPWAFSPQGPGPWQVFLGIFKVPFIHDSSCWQVVQLWHVPRHFAVPMELLTFLSLSQV